MSMLTETLIRAITQWLIPAVIGTTFTLLGAIKLYCLAKGIVGGAEKPFAVRLCGT